MRTRLGFVMAAAAAVGGCAFLGFGPPTGVVEGRVQQSPTFTPAAYAEVCVFGADTICTRADREGRYRIRLTEQRFWLRFRFGNQVPHRSDTLQVLIGGRIESNCAIADRMVVSADPIPCLPVRRG